MLAVRSGRRHPKPSLRSRIARRDHHMKGLPPCMNPQLITISTGPKSDMYHLIDMDGAGSGCVKYAQGLPDRL